MISRKDQDVGFIPMAPVSPALPSSLGTSSTSAPSRQSPYRKIYLASRQPALPVAPKISQPVQQPSNSSSLDSSLGISYFNPANTPPSSTASTPPLSFPIGVLPNGLPPVTGGPRPTSGGRFAM